MNGTASNGDLIYVDLLLGEKTGRPREKVPQPNLNHILLKTLYFSLPLANLTYQEEFP